MAYKASSTLEDGSSSSTIVKIPVPIASELRDVLTMDVHESSTINLHNHPSALASN